MFHFFIFVLVFIGGYAVMSIELLGGRILAPYFGSSIYVWGSIITVFMLALSFGYLIGGALSLRRPDLRKFGVIFLVCAVTVQPLILWGDQIMAVIFDSTSDPRYGSLAAAVALFFIPTVGMGMISPYAVRLLVQDQHRSGHVAGKLYFISTAGSALGTLLTSFYLVLYFNVNDILYTLAALLLSSGLAALLMPPWVQVGLRPGEGPRK